MDNDNPEIEPFLKQQSSYLRKEFRTGTPSFSEWDGLWKSRDDEEWVNEDHYEQVVGELYDYFGRTYTNNPTYLKDFYVRGDYANDKSQVLEVTTPTVLNLEFLIELQRWLLESKHNDWRFIIPTYLTKDEVIVVYPLTIRIAPKYEESLSESIKAIASRMKGYTG